jgi:membrane fusion protein (multidrug efflux system)
MFRHRQRDKYLRPVLPLHLMHEPTEKHSPESPARQTQRPVRGAPQNPIETAPEAFGRSTPPVAEAFGRAQPQPKRRNETPRDRKDRSDEDQADEKEDVNGKGEAEERKPDQKEKADDKTDDDEEPEKPPFYRRPILMTVLIVVVLALATGALLYWLHARHYEKTDDAFIAGHITRISPRVGGQVTKVWIEDNQRVKRGDLLVELDPSDYQASLDQARAGLASAQGKLAEAQANVQAVEASVGQAEAAGKAAATEVERASADLKRYQAVDLRAVSQQQLDAVRATAQSAQANLQAAQKKKSAARAQVTLSQSQVKTEQANVQKAQASLEQAQLNLSYTKIVAPEDGRITNKTVEPGAYLQTGQTLFSLVPREVWVNANFKETQITDMRIGQSVSIKVDAYPHVDFSGKVDSFQAGTGAAFSLLPPENATGNYVKVVQRVPVKIVFDPLPDDRYLIAPGMSAVPKVKVK